MDQQDRAPIDHTLVRRLQVRVGDRLEQHLAERTREGKPPLSGEDLDALKPELVHQVVASHASDQAEAGQTPMTWEEQQDLIQALKNRLLGAGSLEALLRDESIEEISINGYRNVFVHHVNGTKGKVPPVFASNEELIEAMQTLAAHEGLSGRAFDVANPMVNFRLGHARVQATQAVTAVPTVSIRLHHARMRFTVKDLVAGGTMDQDLADFFRAAVRAKLNVMIGGETFAGKTVLLRALCAAMSPEERLITIERALELGLDDDPERHPDVIAMEERLPNAEGEGAVPMRDLLLTSKRMRPDRIIVGEVLGDEVLTMLNAMLQGNQGSISTIHADSSASIVDNICTYAIQAPERLHRSATIALIASGLNFLVFMRRIRTDAGVRRVVASVREVVGHEGETLKTNEIFKPGPDGMAVRDHPVQISDQSMAKLTAAGYGTPDPEGWI